MFIERPFDINMYHLTRAGLIQLKYAVPQAGDFRFDSFDAGLGFHHISWFHQSKWYFILQPQQNMHLAWLIGIMPSY